MVVRGGMGEQVRTAYTKIAAILEGARMSFADVVRVVEYVTPGGIEGYAEAAAVRDQLFGAHRPAINTVPVKSLLRPDAFIEIEVTAGAVGPATDVGRGLPVARESAGVVFLPSILPIDEHGTVVGAGDVVAQTRVIFERAGRMLTALGLGFDRVVKTVDYLTPTALSSYKLTGRVRKDFLGPVYPGAAGIIMPRLLHPDALIRYDFIATQDAGPSSSIPAGSATRSSPTVPACARGSSSCPGSGRSIPRRSAWCTRVTWPPRPTTRSRTSSRSWRRRAAARATS